MKILQYGDGGARVSLLQEGLRRAGFDSGSIDGLFGRQTEAALRAFQRREALPADGLAGTRTQAALHPWYVGFLRHRVRSGESLWRVAQLYRSSLLALETANPGLDPFSLRAGQELIVPLPFPVVPENVPMSAELCAYCVEGLAARYPFLKSFRWGESVLGRPLWGLRWGEGARRVFYNAAHHGNEWITAPLLLQFAEALCGAFAAGGGLFGVEAAALWEKATIELAPLVNPDGVDLVTGALEDAAVVQEAAALAAAYPAVPFPSGWKANIRGVDLNLQYPANWEEARAIKFAQGYTQPGPRDYVGEAPLSAPESRALYHHTLTFEPERILAFHTQGEVIYWKYLDYEPPGSRELARRFSAVSGYAYEETPYASGFAGYKDWFIERFNRPGYTVEAGLGESPLPLSQLPEIWQRCLGILVLCAWENA